MSIRSLAVCLAGVSATIVSFGLSGTKVIAQTVFPFEAVYESENTLVPITENVSRVTITAFSANAPYGLTNFVNTNYGLVDTATGTVTFRPDAAEFGLEGLPLGGVRFFGFGSDQLFGTINGVAQLDFQNLVGTATGTFNITDGSGRFSGATGTFAFVEEDLLNRDPNAPFPSRAFLSGSFQTSARVPEPSNTAMFFGIGVVGIGFGLRQRKLMAARFSANKTRE